MSHVAYEHAEQLIATMRIIHAGSFQKKMGDGVSLAQLKTVIVGALAGVTVNQFNHGLALLSSQAHCPNIAEFRALCMSGSWMSVDEAWVSVCEYTKSDKTRITTHAKYALDQVRHLIEYGSMSAAKNEFKSLYQKYLLKAQMKGQQQQEWYTPPLRIEHNKPPVVEHKHDLSEQHALILTIAKQLEADGMNRFDALKQAQKSVKGEPDQVAAEAAKKLDLPPDSAIWPDPFDNRHAYIDMLKADGKPVPRIVA